MSKRNKPRKCISRARLHNTKKYRAKKERRMLVLMWTKMGFVEGRSRAALSSWMTETSVNYYMGDRNLTNEVEWLMKHQFIMNIGKLTERGEIALATFAKTDQEAA